MIMRVFKTCQLQCSEGSCYIFKKSGYASMLKSLTIIQECATRWNTKLAVLISVHQVFSEI